MRLGCTVRSRKIVRDSRDANDGGIVGEREGMGTSHSATLPDMEKGRGVAGLKPGAYKSGVREHVGEVNSALRESSGSTKRGAGCRSTDMAGSGGQRLGDLCWWRSR